jgi:AcrR family transcriptional regulator
MRRFTRIGWFTLRGVVNNNVAAPPAPQTGDPTDVRSAILDAAVDLFYRQGYSATGVQQVVDAAGRTKGAFYHYWDSKESLLLEIHDTFHVYAISRAHALLERNLPADEALRELIVELFRQLEVYQKHMTVVFHQASYTPYAKYPKSKKLRDEYESIVKSVLEDGVRNGIFRDDLEATNVMAFGLMSFSSWATNWYRPGGPMTAEQIGEMYARVMIDGLRKR